MRIKYKRLNNQGQACISSGYIVAALMGICALYVVLILAGSGIPGYLLGLAGFVLYCMYIVFYIIASVEADDSGVTFRIPRSAQRIEYSEIMQLGYDTFVAEKELKNGVKRRRYVEHLTIVT